MVWGTADVKNDGTMNKKRGRGGDHRLTLRSDGSTGFSDVASSSMLLLAACSAARSRCRLCNRLRQCTAGGENFRFSPRIVTNNGNIHEPGRPLRVHEIPCHLFPSLRKASHSCSSSSLVHGSRPEKGSLSAPNRVPQIYRILTNGRIHGILVPFGTLVVCPTREFFRNFIPTFSVSTNSL